MDTVHKASDVIDATESYRPSRGWANLYLVCMVFMKPRQLAWEHARIIAELLAALTICTA